MKRSWEERASEGEELAAQVGSPDADERLLELLLDPDNTAVTFRTAVALLDRRSLAAVRMIAVASAMADDNHMDFLGDAVAEFRARSLGGDDQFLRGALESIGSEADSAYARAAQELHAWCGWA